MLEHGGNPSDAGAEPDLTRPVLRWHGGKWRLAPWIIRWFPRHRIYVEPFGGAASVLLRKPRAYAEVYNDLDHEVVNLFRVLRDEASARRLIESVRLTPFAREEFELAYSDSPDPLEQARRLLARSFMGHGSDGATGTYRTGFRANTTRAGTTPAGDWLNFPEGLSLIVERLRGVVIEHRDASEVMRIHDGPETLHYADPPYLEETRSRVRRRPGGGTYRHELSSAEHLSLLDLLDSLEGMVVLSGYPSESYDRRLGHWRRVERPARADGARDRLEVLWVNPAAVAALGNGPLFGGAA